MERNRIGEFYRLKQIAYFDDTRTPLTGESCFYGCQSLTKVYGLRLFRNESSFRMHIDKKGSHSVGYVLHVDSSDDTEPWPFFIEDFHGRTHEINLTPGDVIMFEGMLVVLRYSAF